MFRDLNIFLLLSHSSSKLCVFLYRYICVHVYGYCLLKNFNSHCNWRMSLKYSIEKREGQRKSQMCQGVPEHTSCISAQRDTLWRNSRSTIWGGIQKFIKPVWINSPGPDVSTAEWGTDESDKSSVSRRSTGTLACQSNVRKQ